LKIEYDANGNTTGGPDFTDTAATGTRTVTYNMDNMPATLTYTKGGNTTVSEFTYDGAGLRAKKKVGGSATYYVNANYEVKDGVATKYITAADLKVAQIKGNAVSYYHKDHLNSSSVMTNVSGVKVEGTEYAPYGTVRAFAGTPVTSYRYTGKELDTDTGLYYYGARYYDPMIGRFITADSVVSDFYDPQDLNRYAYARNNPMKYVDPNGHAYAETGGQYDLFSTYNIFTGNVLLDNTVVSAYNSARNLSAFAINAAINTVGIIDGLKDSAIRGMGGNKSDIDLVNFVLVVAGSGALNVVKAESKVAVEGAKTAAKKANFIVDSNGTAVRNSASGARQDLEAAGFPGTRTTETLENGTIHKGLPGKDGPMDVRVMDGQANGGAYKGERVRTTREGHSNDGVRSDGSKFRNNESKYQRLEESHIQLNQ